MDTDVLGIVAPHPPIMVSEVGGDESRVTHDSEAAMRELGALLHSFAPETVLVVSPHAPGFWDAFTVTMADRLKGDLGQFRASSVGHDVPGDPELARAIIEETAAAGLPVVAREDAVEARDTALDHGVLVPMHFLDPNDEFPLVVVTFAGLSTEAHREFGRAIMRAAEKVGRRVAFVASGDMSHRLLKDAPAGFSPRAHLFDESVASLLARADFDGIACIDPALREEAGECGWRSLLVLGGFLEGSGAAARVLSYEGPWGVGYLTAAFASPAALEGLAAYTPSAGAKGGMPGTVESAPVALARATIEAFVRTNAADEDPPSLADDDLPARAGAFVSLHTPAGLRGCIGTIGPTQSTLAAEIAHNAVQAASQDPRFPPVTTSELGDLEITVDVLDQPEPISSLDELDPKVYGVITTCGWRRGLLLPDLEGVDSCEEQVAIAMSKAGIRSDETISLERFKVIRYA
jgi:AmmeMemoRadiSam system protein A/AmmeMemoRadiSam system protein B